MFIKVEDFRINPYEIVAYRFEEFKDPVNCEGVLIIDLKTRGKPITVLGDKTLLEQLDEKLSECEVEKC